MKINPDNMIITIDTELCANGEKIAKELADMLHLPCYGEEILDSWTRPLNSAASRPG